MSSKIGLLISLVFFALFFLLSMDVLSIQYHYSDLDNQSIVIGYELARLETITDEEITNLENKHHIVFKSISNRSPQFGEVVDYTISREYKPIIIKNEGMELKINRSTVIGYY